MVDQSSERAQVTDLTSSAYWEQQWNSRRDVRGTRRGRKILRRLRRRQHALMGFLSNQVDALESSVPDVLELGCAPGGILGDLHRWRPAARLHGLDYAEQGLVDTERFFARIGVPATLHCGDLRSFEPGRQYDLVYSCGLVEHFTDPVPILRHHARLCRAGGRVAVTVPNYSGCLQEWLMSRLDPTMIETHNLATMNPARLSELMRQAGLFDVSAGQFGMGKFCTRCSVRNWRTQSLRVAAKTWNAARRVLPLAPHWYATIWAVGRVDAAQGRVAA